MQAFDAAFLSYFLSVVFTDALLETSNIDGHDTALDPEKLKFIEGIKSSSGHNLCNVLPLLFSVDIFDERIGFDPLRKKAFIATLNKKWNNARRLSKV